LWIFHDNQFKHKRHNDNARRFVNIDNARRVADDDGDSISIGCNRQRKLSSRIFFSGICDAQLRDGKSFPHHPKPRNIQSYSHLHRTELLCNELIELGNRDGHIGIIITEHNHNARRCFDNSNSGDNRFSDRNGCSDNCNRQRDLL
jgi:hypothetical protein